MQANIPTPRDAREHAATDVAAKSVGLFSWRQPTLVALATIGLILVQGVRVWMIWASETSDTPPSVEVLQRLAGLRFLASCGFVVAFISSAIGFFNDSRFARLMRRVVSASALLLLGGSLVILMLVSRSRLNMLLSVYMCLVGGLCIASLALLALRHPLGSRWMAVVSLALSHALLSTAVILLRYAGPLVQTTWADDASYTLEGLAELLYVLFLVVVWIEAIVTMVDNKAKRAALALCGLTLALVLRFGLGSGQRVSDLAYALARLRFTHEPWLIVVTCTVLTCGVLAFGRISARRFAWAVLLLVAAGATPTTPLQMSAWVIGFVMLVGVAEMQGRALVMQRSVPPTRTKDFSLN